MFSLRIKAILAGAGALALALFAGIIRFRYVKAQRDSLRESAETYKAQLHQAILNDQRDAEIEQDFSRRAEQAKEAIRNGQVPDHLRSSDF